MIMNNLMLLPKSIQGFCFCMGIFSWNEMNSIMHFFCQWVSIRVPFYHFFHILYLFPLTCRYPNNEHENDSANGQGFDFEKVVYVDELGNEEDMEDDDLPPDLLRLVEQNERQILPHQKITEAINLGTEEERKKVKIGTTLSPAIRKELIDLLQD